MPFAPSKGIFAIGLETVRGTAVPPSYYMPVDNSVSITPKITYLDDQGLRGSPVVNFDKRRGVEVWQATAKFAIFPDTFPVLMEALLGGVDVVQADVPIVGTNTHTIPLADTGAPYDADTQPMSWTISYSDGEKTRTLAGCMLSKIDLNFSVDGTIEANTTWLAQSEVDDPPLLTAAFSDERMVPGWSAEVSVLIGATPQTATVQEGSLTLDRAGLPIYTIGASTPYFIWDYSLDTSGDLTAVSETGDLLFEDGYNDPFVEVNIKFTEPDTGYTAEFQMSKVKIIDPVRDYGKQYTTVKVGFAAVGNTDDAVGGGYSNVLFTAENDVLAPYSTP